MAYSIPAPFLTAQQPVGMPTNMLGNINIEKYRIRSVSMISEATWTPRILIRHFDGLDFSYNITREQIEDYKKNGNIDNLLEEIVWLHIKAHCPVYLRKEKLEQIQKLNHFDINL
jgi:hypothetical protein